MKGYQGDIFSEQKWKSFYQNKNNIGLVSPVFKTKANFELWEFLGSVSVKRY